MTPILSFDEALAQAWAPLERRLGLLKGFGFIVLFVKDGRLAQALKLKVAAWAARRAWAWADVALTVPEGFSQTALSSLFDQIRAGGCHLAWLEAQRGAGQPAWDAERLTLLRRLNERRSRLESELPGAFILLLPDKGMRDIATLAPDLWHVRIHTAELRFDAALGTAWQPLPLSKPLAPMVANANAKLNASAPAALVFWRRQWQAWVDAVGPDWPTSADEFQQGQLSLWDGWRAVDECLGRGRLADAGQIAQDVLQLASMRLQRLDGAGNSALREYAIALDRVAAAAAATADLAKALDFYEQSLLVMRDLSAQTGFSVAPQRELAVALTNVADTAMAMGQLDRAEAAWAEALSIFRAVATPFAAADAVQTADDLIGVLVRIGTLAAARADWPVATSYFQEALELARRDYAREVQRSTHPSTETLHRLLMTMTLLAGNVMAQGDWSRADALAEEGQRLCRAQLQRSADDPTLSRDLLQALHVSSTVARLNGESARAERVEGEILTLSNVLITTPAAPGNEKTRFPQIPLSSHKEFP